MPLKESLDMSKPDNSHKYRLSWISRINKKDEPFSVQFMVVETNNELEVIERVNYINNKPDTFLPVKIERIVPLLILNKELIQADETLSVYYRIMERIGFNSKETLQELFNEKRELEKSQKDEDI